MEIGLVDKLGGLDVAIATAAELAKITNYGILIYPAQPNWFEKMFGNQNKTSMKQALSEEFGELYFAFDGMKSILRMKGVQARIPMTIEME
jgi:protease IV